MIRKFLDLSTGYLTQATAKIVGEGCGPSPTYEHPEGFGFFIWVPEAEDLPTLEDCPPDLMACFLRARALGCDYICFDADGPDDDKVLPWYDGIDEDQNDGLQLERERIAKQIASAKAGRK